MRRSSLGVRRNAVQLNPRRSSRRPRWARLAIVLAMGVGLGLGALSLSEARAQATDAPGVFDAPVVQAGYFSRFNRMLDFNSDGRPDTLGYWFVTSEQFRVEVFRNDPDQMRMHWTKTFNGQRDEPGLVDWVPIDAGEINGLPGFALDTREAGLQIWLWIYTAPTRWEVRHPQNLTDIHLTDWDGNGLGDVVAIGGDQLTVIRTFGVDEEPVVETYTLTAARERFTLVDLDGAGMLDVVAWDSDGVELYRNTGAGVAFLDGFTPSVGIGKVAAGDIDNDGDTDLVYFGHDFSSLEYEVMRRTGADSFTLEAPRPGGPASDLVDLDGDGRLDGICCGGGGGGPPAIFNELPVSFFLSLQDELGDFPVAHTMEGLGANHLAGATDMNGDGYVDLVAGRIVYYGREGSYEPRRLFSPGAPISSAFAVDCHDDGDLDLGFGDGDRYLANAGDGRFLNGTLERPAAPAGMTYGEQGFPGDWNGDGKTDLIVEMYEGSAFVGMRLLASEGGRLVDRGFAAPEGLQMGIRFQHPMESRVAFRALDANDDGALDLVHRAQGVSGKLWINDGTGFFAESETFLEGYVTHVADFDRDGRLDLLLQGDSKIYTRFGEDAGFSPASLVSGTQQRQLAPAIGDVNGSTKTDIVTVATTGRVIFLLNNGDRTFRSRNAQTPLYLASPTRDFETHFIDLDVDGRKDLVLTTVDRGDNRLMYSPGTDEVFRYGAKVEQVARPTALVDVDSDGDLDVIFERASDGRVRLVRNRTFEGDADGFARQFGRGLEGTGGRVPVLGAKGPFRPGSPGEIRMREGIGRGRAILVIGRDKAEIPTKGGMLYVDPWKLKSYRLSGPADLPGMGDSTISFPDAPNRAIGECFYLQLGVLDPAAVEGLSLSNALQIQFGVE